MGRLQLPELIVIFLITALSLAPFVGLVWAVLTVRRVGSRLSTVEQRVEAIERTLTKT